MLKGKCPGLKFKNRHYLTLVLTLRKSSEVSGPSFPIYHKKVLGWKNLIRFWIRLMCCPLTSIFGWTKWKWWCWSILPTKNGNFIWFNILRMERTHQAWPVQGLYPTPSHSQVVSFSPTTVYLDGPKHTPFHPAGPEISKGNNRFLPLNWKILEKNPD